MRRSAVAVLPALLVVALAGCLSACGSGTGGKAQASPGSTAAASTQAPSSTSGGATWHTQYSATGAALNGVAFANASDGWAVGGASVADSGGESAANGGGDTILATSNGGATWETQYSDTAGGFLSAVAFVNASDGWAVGNDGTILATSNGGATWKAQDSGTTADLHGVAFANARDGWAVGGALGVSTIAGGSVALFEKQGIVVILATTDGGATWKVQSPGTTAALAAVAFVNTNDGWAVGAGHPHQNSGQESPFSAILATTDGGATWKVQKSAANVALFDVAFANAGDGWAVGASSNSSGSSATGLILATTNGGVTWKVQKSGAPPNTGLTGVAFANASDGWAVGVSPNSSGSSGTGLILATTNGGATWQVQKPDAPPDAFLTGAAFASASDGWAVGASLSGGGTATGNPTGGVVLATTNGGN